MISDTLGVECGEPGGGGGVSGDGRGVHQSPSFKEIKKAGEI